MSLQNTLSSERIRMAHDVQEYLEAMGSKVLHSRFGVATPLLIVDEAPSLLRGAATEFVERINGHQRKGWVVYHNGCRVIWREHQDGICEAVS
ncbi:hypothetical protein ACW5WQ_19835 [Aeromonas rivuli]|uniref:hypothetical protein n=1 Tax=Aeromonas rivuli TaxID=648794 RepID=UPI0005A7A591|nr:hypothetical protein [Aeromonas rivuli]